VLEANSKFAKCVLFVLRSWLPGVLRGEKSMVSNWICGVKDAWGGEGLAWGLNDFEFKFAFCELFLLRKTIEERRGRGGGVNRIGVVQGSVARKV
jgi:hypothetical protein